MMDFSETYDSTAFHGILSLHDADKQFRSKSGLSFVQTKLKSLILQHGVANLFGVALVHRHFDLEEGTILVEKDMVTAPWKCDNSFAKHGGKIIPISWLCKEGRPRPYEFGFFSYSKEDPSGLEGHASFVEAFFDTINLHGLADSVGLRRLTGHESGGMLECTEGKVNIMFPSNEVPDEYLQRGTDTMWFFDGQPPYRMYRCIFNMTDPFEVLTEASRLRSGIPCSLADESPCIGGSHRVFKVIFDDSVRWAARVSNDSNNWKSELRAVRQFQHVKKQCPEIKAPSLFVEEEHPVLYSEWVSGKPLAVWNSQIPFDKRLRILNDLAEFLMQTWTTPVPSELAQEKNCLYSVWLTESLDRGLRRTLAGTARWGNAINYLIMRSMISDYAAEFDNYTGIGFTHGDLNAHNIMRSDDFHLTGVIDWDWMSVAPLPAIIHHPWFMADIPGWNNDGVAEGESFAEDRLCLEDLVKMKEFSQHLPPTVSTLLKDSGKRLHFQSAFHFKDIHETFVTMHCPWTEDNISAATLQLDTVLCLYPELGDKERVLEIKNLLGRNDKTERC
ncbi:hypothetical protein N7448_010954 [Penicillium atrosanguineum]|nr:hypothetical protein N7448_010954 [Penicillium atrosanguineum]